MKRNKFQRYCSRNNLPWSHTQNVRKTKKRCKHAKYCDFRWLEVRGCRSVGVRGCGVGAAAASAELGVASQPVALTFANDAGGAAGVAQAAQTTHRLHARAARLPRAQIPLPKVPVSGRQRRRRRCPQPQRNASQNLVPEQKVWAQHTKSVYPYTIFNFELIIRVVRNDIVNLQ